MTTAFVFGGAGFIGRHLVAYLAGRDRQVVICDVREPQWILPAGARYVWSDVRHPIEVPASEHPEVFNLAAIHRTPGHPDHEYHETNESGARTVTQFCDAVGATDLWFTSSIAVYGPSEDPTTEGQTPAPNSAYGRSKLQAEQTHVEWAKREPGRRLVVVRPGTVFGPGEGGNFTRLASTLKRHRFVYPGRKDTVKACGYVGDLIESMLYMQQFATPTVTYNYSYAPPPTIEEVCEAFRAAGGLPRPLGVVPEPVLLAASQMLARMGVESFRPERVVKLTRSTNIVPKRLVESGFEYRTSLESGLRAWLAESPHGEFV